MAEARKRRGYSREFTPRGEGKAYMIDRIPTRLWQRVRAKARREGVSVRSKILSGLRAWVDEPSHG